MANIIDKQKAIITKLSNATELVNFKIYNNLINEYRQSSIIVEPNGNKYLETNVGSIVNGYKFSIYLATLTDNSQIQDKRETLENAREAVLDNILNVQLVNERPLESVSASNKFSLYLLEIETTL